MPTGRRLAVLALAGLMLAAVGCGTTHAGRGGGTAGGRVSAASARSRVESAVRDLYVRRLYRAGIGYATSLDGGYESCPRAPSRLRFTGGTDVYPLHSGVSPAAYARAAAGALRSGGWLVRPSKSPVRASVAVSYYAIAKGGLTGDMYVVPASSAGPRAVLGVSSGCFAPGSRRDYPTRYYHLALPHPGAAG
jgi:hypothetical protein